MNSRKPLENRKLMFLLFFHFSFTVFKLSHGTLSYSMLISIERKHWYLFPFRKELHENVPVKWQIRYILTKNSKGNLNDSLKYRRMNAGLMTTTLLQFIVFLIKNTIWNSRPGEYIIPNILSTTSRIALDDKHLWRLRIAWQYKT